MESDHDGEHIIDMDQVADAVGKEEDLKPKFFMQKRPNKISTPALHAAMSTTFWVVMATALPAEHIMD